MMFRKIYYSWVLAGFLVLMGGSEQPIVKAVPLEYSIKVAEAIMSRYDSIVHHMDHLDKRTSWQYDYALLAEAIGIIRFMGNI